MSRRWQSLQCGVTIGLVPLLGYWISRIYFVSMLFGAPSGPIYAPRCSSARGVAKTPPPSTLAGPNTTFCNPLDLPYNFQPNQPEYREAADPSMVVYKDTYFLFVSKSGGYFYSKDLIHWTLVEPVGLPLSDYAPTAMVMGDRMYFTASFSMGIFATDDPFKGIWSKVADIDRYWDPFLYQDDDGKVYLSWGCSNTEPIRIVQVEPTQGWRIVKGPTVVAYGEPNEHGWESAKFTGVMKTILGNAPFIEGPWINKVGGRYVLQYAGPGTELKAYGDGVFVSKVSPMGPYLRDRHSPVSHKPTGFIAGAGHGSTFQDLQGRWWHIGTGLISVRHNFERRIMLFPAYFDEAASPAHFRNPGGKTTTFPSFLVDTMLGDYPMRLDQTRPAWQLLSYAKRVTASSSEDKHPPFFAVNEDIQNWWSAATGNAGEWIALDLGSEVTVHAAQINFADQGAVVRQRLDDAYLYHAEWSLDGASWTVLPDLDRRENTRDASQDYVELKEPLRLRHFRLVSACVPGGARFSVSGLRLFGVGPGAAPERVSEIMADRDVSDPRRATVSWDPVEGAMHYVVRYGLEGGPLFQHLMVYAGATSTFVDALSRMERYTFVVDSLNEAGLTRGEASVTI